MFKYGSFNWYENLGDDFFSNLTKAFMHADLDNLRRLGKIFPHIDMAHSLYSWDDAPETRYPATINVGYNKELDFRSSVNNITPGCFYQYLYFSGHFVTYLSGVIYQADEHNLELISQQYPQMIAAYKLGSDKWDMCPEGFESNTYNSPPKTLEKTLDSH